MYDSLTLIITIVVYISFPLWIIIDQIFREEQESPLEEEAPLEQNDLILQENPLVKKLHATTLPPEVALLSEKECAMLHSVINSNSSSKILDKLKVRLNQYEDYKKRVDLLNSAIENKALNDNDELIPHTEIINPVLFYKEYYSKEQWKVEPASPKITDKKTLLLMLNSGKHYITRESLENPPQYKNKYKPTHFRWYDYNGRSYELERMAQSLRDNLSHIVDQDTKTPTL